MIAIILVLLAAFAACLIFEKNIHETLPVAVFDVTLGVYVFALFFSLPIAVYLTILIVLIVLAAGVVVDNSRKKAPSLVSTRSDTRLVGNLAKYQRTPILFAGNIHTYALSISALVLIIICVVMCILVYNHRVFFYDDLSYWALYTKNIFCIDHLPSLYENCSVNYKYYTPIMQILQYIALFGRKTFSEPVLFMTNICFVYIMLLPIMSVAEEMDANLSVRITSGILYVIFPFIFTTQFLYRLGVDLFIAVVFGYSLYMIFVEKDEGIFRIVSLVCALSFLPLIKTSGIVLSIFALVIFFVKEMAERQRLKAVFLTSLLSLFTFGSYLSWQFFLRRSGNKGYLSERIKNGVKEGSFAFPECTGSVSANYIKHFFTYPLTRYSYGVTAFVLVIFVVAVFVISRRINANARRVDTVDGYFESETCSLPVFIASLTCLVIFAISHLAMYLFVFDDWEAFGLLEFDRYITQYLGGLFMAYMCILIAQAGSFVRPGRGRAVKGLLYLSTVVFLALLPYNDLMTYLIPPNYEEMYAENNAKLEEDSRNEWSASGIEELDLSHDGSARLTVITNEWDDYAQFFEYTAVPQPIDKFINVPAIDPEGINICMFVQNVAEEYVYVTKNAPESYKGDWDITSELTNDNAPLRGGALYKVTKAEDTKTLTAIN